jgi:hypothetical protein
VETYSDLDIGREVAEVEEVVIAVVRGERNQEQEGAGEQGWPTLAIKQPWPCSWAGTTRKAFNAFSHGSDGKPIPISL